MRLLVCGGRNYNDEARVVALLDRIHATVGISLLIEGGASGADDLARNWAEKNNVNSLVFKADWSKYGKAAGPMRNTRMIDEGEPDGVLAFPGGIGTADMVKKALQADLKVMQIR